MGGKSVHFKILFGILVIFIISIIGGITYISFKISPEQIRTVVLQNLTKTFPNSEFVLEDINYSIGLSLNLDVKKFEVTSKRKTKNEVLKINDIKISVPFWAILTGGGAVEFIVDRPEVYFYMFNKTENNFGYAFEMGNENKKSPSTPQINEEKTVVSTEKKEDENVKIINFFIKSSLNIKFTNISVTYFLENDQKGQVKFEKFLIKNLNFVESTSFEIATLINATVGKDNLSLKGLLIGDVNFNEILKGKDLKTSLRLTIEDLSFGELIEKFPTINTDLKVGIEKKTQKIDLNLNTDISGVGFVRAIIEVNGEKIYVQGIDSQIDVKELFNATKQKIEMISPNNSKFSLLGSVQINKGKITPKLNFTLKPGIIISPDKNLSIENELKGSLDNLDVELTSLTKLFKGEVETKINTKFDVNSPVVDPAKLAPVNVNVVMNDIKFDENYIHESIYKKENVKNSDNQKPSGSAENKATKVDSTKNNQATGPVVLPRVNLKLSWRNIFIGSQVFAGNSKILLGGNKIASDDFSFNFSKGKGKIDFIVKLLENDGNDTSFNFNLDSLNLDSLKPFMPPQIEVITGTFTGKVNGEVKLSKASLKHNIDFDINAVNGEVKGIKIGPVVQSVADNFSFTKGKADGVGKTVSNNFETLSIVGNAKETKYLIKSFKFLGINKSAEITGNGAVYPPEVGETSEMYLNVQDNTGMLSSTLEQQTGSKILPILLKGKGFDLKPDYLYTTKILAKGAIDKNKGKVTEKVKTEGKKKVEEFLKDDKNKEKIKGMLKGLF